jgi:hypothetical protein
MRHAGAPGVKWVPVDVDDTADHVFGAAGRMPVWAGASASTIYGDPAGNIAFRAWHDMEHRTAGRGFDLRSELYVVTRQCAAVERESRALADALWFDNAGQQLYFYVHGRFPFDQMAFAMWFEQTGCVDRVF